MASAPPLFYVGVVRYVDWAMLIGFLVIEIVAIVHCATQRADAFPVVGSISKTGWLAILGGAVLVTLLCRGASVFGSFFSFLGMVAALIYLLDVRPALRDATDGAGPW